MIKIIEDKPKSLSGNTSLFVSFKFNQNIIDIIKRFEKYIYDKKTYTWELPISSLSYLLDNLTYIDDIELKLYEENDDKRHYYPILNHQYEPYQHQREGIEFGLNHDNFLLLDEPGLGKTLQCIYLAEELKAQKGLEHCLIICGINTLKVNWKKEIKKYSNLSCRILGENVNSKGKITYSRVKDRAKEILEPFKDFFIITNIETIRSDEVIEALNKTKNKIEMIVLDEAHKVKNVSSVQGHNLLKLKNYEHKIALTGTLIMNRPIDAFAALKWTGFEKSNFTNFKSQYCVFGGFGGHQIVGYKNLDILKDVISRNSLRRTKADMKDLPPKSVIIETVELDDQNRMFYDRIKDGVKSEADKIELNKANTLALSTRLRQATSCPSMITTENIIPSKISRAVDLVEDICAYGEKVVIMSVFKEPLNLLKKLLSEYNPLLCSGDVSDDDVNKNIDLFMNDPKYKVFLGTASKCGTGINLNSASYMICIETPWTYALQEQVEDRINRINNTKSATIYRLISEDTIDEVVEKLIETKQAMSDYMIDDVSSQNTIEILKNYITDL